MPTSLCAHIYVRTLATQSSSPLRGARLCRVVFRAAFESNASRQHTTSRHNNAIEDLIARQRTSKQAVNERIKSLDNHAALIEQREQRLTHGVTLTNNGASNHHDLTSFHAYAAIASLNTDSTVYKGTLFEYTVADSLKDFGMVLARVGKANDLGIDLVGQWTLPNASTTPVLIQCKMAKPLPQMVRELEGSCSSAPSSWIVGQGVALLASRHKASPGVIRALQSSPLPLGFLQVASDGVVKQFLWNTKAGDGNLSGLAVTTRHGTDRLNHQLDGKSLVFTWLGKPVVKPLRVQRRPPD